MKRSETAQFAEGDRLLCQREVAGIIRKSEAWLERKRWEGGGIPFKKIGRNVRYRESVVMQWINDQPTMRSTSDQSAEG